MLSALKDNKNFNILRESEHVYRCIRLKTQTYNRYMVLVAQLLLMSATGQSFNRFRRHGRVMLKENKSASSQFNVSVGCAFRIAMDRISEQIASGAHELKKYF